MGTRTQFTLAVALLLAIAGELGAQSGSVRPRCCGTAYRAAPSCPTEQPPCISVGCYDGDTDTNRLIETDGCTPDVVWVKRKSVEENTAGLWRTRDMGTDISIPLSPGELTTFSNGIRDLVPTGFTVGENLETNDLLDRYCWYAFQAKQGFLEYGTYTGDNETTRELHTEDPPGVFLLYGRSFLVDNRQGLRMRTPELAGARTLLLDGAGDFDLQSDDVTALRSIPNGDSYNGAELGLEGNRGGRQYFWISFVDRPDFDDRWLFHGSYQGTGTDTDGSERIINTPCRSQTVMAVTSADTGGTPGSLRFFGRFFRHYLVAPDLTNWGQRMNVVDLSAEPPGADDGGWRRFEPGAITFGNGFSGGATTMMNITGSTYYYWGLCR